MNAQETAAYLATLVGLICNWKQERGSQATDKALDFLLYLENHNFNELRSNIIDSDILQRELNALLRQDAVQLSEKLDMLCRTMAGLSERLETFAPLAQALGVQSGGLSRQAIAVLKLFVESGAQHMIYFQTANKLGLSPGGHWVENIETRFLNDDLSALETLGFIRVAKWNSSGEPVYSLTRLGAECAPQFSATSG